MGISRYFFLHIAMVLCLPAVTFAENPLLKDIEDIYCSNRREPFLQTLEDAVQENPESIDHWEALALALLIHEPTFADRVSRLALKLHPNNPQLLVVRAKVCSQLSFGRSTAWDVLDDLGRIPGQHDRSILLKELLSVGRLQGYNGRDEAPLHVRAYPGWAQDLISTRQLDRVPAVVRQGLSLTPEEPRLIELLPFCLAIEGKLETAIQMHIEQGRPFTVAGDFLCLADFLISRGEYAFAVASCGDDMPESPKLRRIYALALAKNGDVDSAEEFLGTQAEDDLLRIQFALLQDHDEEIKTQIPRLLEPRGICGAGGWMAPNYAFAGGSLGHEYREAILWLYKEFPNDHQGVYHAFGDVVPLFHYRDRWMPDEETQRSARRFIAWIHENQARALPKDRLQINRTLAKVLAEGRRFQEAALALVGNAALPQPDKGLKGNGWFSEDAVQWAILRQQALADELFESAPWDVLQSRRLLAELRDRNTSAERREQIVTQLLAMPSGFLGVMMEEMQPRVGTGEDRRHFIRFFEKHGTEADAAILIHILRQLGDWPKDRWIDPSTRQDVSTENAEAINACLMRYTRVTETPDSIKERAFFWALWWDENSERIVRDDTRFGAQQ